ncbi:MAG: amino acid adenylation domain-containing protein, partial [Ignavibacteria bacterium]|nr:amino acid adenylation domain-containing protein [Ignavibacteria bacterium]
NLFNYYRIIGSMYSRYFASGPVRVIMTTTIMFDASIQQIMLMLYGNRLYIPKDDVRHDPVALSEYIVENKIDILDCVPTLLKMFLSNGLFNKNTWKPSLVLAGGEALDEAAWKEMLKIEGCDFFNTYGPTETTVDAAICSVKDSPEKPVIGKPPLNVEAYILDNSLNLAPVGVPGELCIGGLSVGRGYLKRPELTAEKFIPDAYGRRPGGRLYRTGDLARYNENGTIEFLGRIDSQIKLRGLRIELGEIENAVLEFDDIKDSVVVAREDIPGEKRIVAYIVVRDGNAFQKPQLMRYLSERLPEYMIPSAFVILQKLPVTPNGKVDRRALPAPDINEIMKEMESNYAAPRTVVEEVVSAIWAGVLNLPKVGINDNFFELGGHSLLATQVISRIKKEFNMEIPLRSIFENPTVARLSHIVEAAEMEKNGLAGSAILPVSRGTVIPLSFAQERLWFLDQLEPGNIAYNVPEALRIYGKMNVEMLEESLNIITSRHEILRTVFLSREGKPYQKIIPEFNVAVRVIEAGDFSREEQEVLIRDYISKEAQKPFVLDTLPLFRALLIRLSEDESVMILIIHHIITDGWSSRKMFSELLNYYHQLENGEHPAVHGLPVQYADYAAWQREYFSGENLSRHIEYWTAKLKGSPQILELPTDRPRPAVQSYKGGFISLELPGKLGLEVNKINRNYGVTLFMSLLSVFQVLLYRYSGESDILVGTPIANRNRADIEDLIGFFVNILVLRVNISDKMKFSDLLRQTKECALEAYTYQDLPFEMIIDALHLERSMSFSPLFQVMFFSENLQTDNSSSNSGIDVRQIDIPVNTSKYDITLSAVETKDGLRLAFEYSTDLFDKETMEMMLRQYGRILECVALNPEVKIKEIPLLSAKEEEETLRNLINGAHDKSASSGKNNNHLPLLLSRKSKGEVLWKWNRRDKEAETVSPVRLINRIFEEQALINPERTAVVAQNGSITFGELNRRANMLSYYLRKKGAGEDEIVGVLTGRSTDLFTAILGILKSGAAYLPLDPVYPKGRIDYILKDAGVRLLISEEGLKDELIGKGFEVILMDSAWPEISNESGDDPITEACPENIAYVIYTSGSTGKPKGSIVQHENFYNLYASTGAMYTSYFSPGPARVTLNSTIMFDASIRQLTFMLYGNTIYLTPEDLRRDALALSEYIVENKIDILDCVPTLLKVFLSTGLFNKDTWRPSLVLAGGEALDEAAWKEMLKIDRCDFFNEYGPTETTVAASAAGVKDFPERPTIGRPILNVELYILDASLNLAPIGAPGELCIGGLSVGRGYLKRPELTAEKFIPDAYGRRPGGRLYRTGDLARYNENGTIEFLGRIDSQIKLRGFRIELGEIEQVLLQHEKVKDAVVILREGKKGQASLAAYITLKPSPEGSLPEFTPAEVKEFLRHQLPDYMVPPSIVKLDRMPLAPSGKIDRRSLPEPAADKLQDENKSPETESERILSEVWKNVLGLEEVGLNDNFFEIGGDSILAIQVVAKARERGLKIQPSHLFKHQTIAQMALLINEESGEDNAEEEFRGGKINLLPVQSSFFEQNLVQKDHWNQSVFFEINDRVELNMLEEVVRAILKHHDVLRSVFIQEDGRWIMQVMPDIKELPLRVFDLSSLPEERLKDKIEAHASEIQSSLDIEKGPVIRFAYFKLGEGKKDNLLIAAHHLVIDVVSWRILLEDILSAYSQIKKQKPVLLPPKSASYRKWSEYLIRHASSEELRQEIIFWLKQPYNKITPLKGVPPEVKYAEKDYSEVNSSGGVTQSLIHEALKRLNCNVVEVLLTALTRAYSLWSEKRILMIDLEGHGRETFDESIDLSRTLGWFTCLYPVLLDLKSSVYPLESLKEIKEQLRSVPRHGIGYGILKYLSLDDEVKRKFNSLPQSEISFNYLGQLNELPQEENILFAPSVYNRGPERGLLNYSRYLIDIVCFVSGGSFYMQMRYCSKVFSLSKIKRFSDLFMDELRLIVEHSEHGQVELSGSDFPLAHLNREKFDKVLNRINNRTSKA